MKNNATKNITFLVRKSYRSTYNNQHLVGEDTGERISLETAKRVISYILENEYIFSEKSVVWSFAGEGVFKDIDLIDEICDCLKLEMYRRKHRWFNSYRFSFVSDGLNYDDVKVQAFIGKNKMHLNIVMAISNQQWEYDIKNQKNILDKEVVSNLLRWHKQFPTAPIKTSIRSIDLPFVKERVLYFYSYGIHEVNINCVYDEVWKDGDATLLEEQLTDLADIIIDNGFYHEYACSFFDENIGKPMDVIFDNDNSCRAGKSLAIDAEGVFYPCAKFAHKSIPGRDKRTIGNIVDGLDQNKLRPFLVIDRCSQSDEKCINCEIASGCRWCQWDSYSTSEMDTIFKRSTLICKMHKARVRANNYYWRKMKLKIRSEQEQIKTR